MTSLTSCITKAVPTDWKALSGHSVGPTGPVLPGLLPIGGLSSTSTRTSRLRTSCQSAGRSADAVHGNNKTQESLVPAITLAVACIGQHAW